MGGSPITAPFAAPINDPLAGLQRPLGSPEAMEALGSGYVSGGTALGHTSQVLAGMVGRLLAQAWSGQAAMACAESCTRDAAGVAMAADAYQLGGAALNRFATELADAQGRFDRARALADEAMADERREQQQLFSQQGPLLPMLIGASVSPSPLRASSQAMAHQAIADAQRAAQVAATTLSATLKPFQPKPTPAPKPKKSSHHWYSPVTGFLGGAWDSVKDPAVMVGGLVGLHGDTGQNWQNLGSGLWHGVTHPVDLGKALIDWQDLSQGHYARWSGELIPGAVAAFFTGGGAAALKGADAVGATSELAKGLEGLSDADKAAILSRGEALVPGSVGSEAAAKYLTAGGRLDYAGVFDSELKNFRQITSMTSGPLDHDLWLSNVHDGSAALNAGRSLKFSAPLDEVLGNTRGGYLRRLALVPQWGKRTDMSLIHIPAGTDVTIAQGSTAAQLSTHTVAIAGKDLTIPTGVKLGGGTQALLKDVDKNWVVWTGKAPWTGAAANLPRGAATGAATFGAIRVPDALADLAQQGAGG